MTSKGTIGRYAPIKSKNLPKIVSLVFSPIGLQKDAFKLVNNKTIHLQCIGTLGDISEKKEVLAMKKIFTTKVSIQSSDPTYSYPLIRFPRAFRELVGKTVSIYQAEINGVAGFFVVPLLDNLDNLNKFVQKGRRADQNQKMVLIDKKSQKTNGLGRIRTGDLRHVKATS
jgi:hypothetical protein